MKTRIDGRFLAGLLIVLTVLAGCAYCLRGYQVKRNAGILRAEAERAEERGDLLRAADYLGRYLAIAPADAASRGRYGLLLDRLAAPPNPQGRLEAFLTLERAVRRLPDRADLRRDLVRIAMASDLGRHGDACEHLHALLRSFPNDAALESLLARCLEAGGDPRGAAGWYRRALEHDRAQVESGTRLARLLRQKLGQPGEADQVMDDLVKANPKAIRAPLARARYFQEQGRLEEAGRDVRAARELAPDDVEVLLESAALARGAGRFAEALAHLQHGLKSHPRAPGIYLALATTHLQAGARPKAIEVLRLGVKELPGQRDLMWNLADLLLQAGETDEAGKIAARLRRARFTPALLDYLAARAPFARQRWLAAATALERLRPRLTPWPDLVRETDLLLGDAYARLGHADRQHAAYRRVVAADPLSVPGCLGLGSALTALGKLDDAIDVYDRVIPRVPGARLVVARLMIARNLQRPLARRDWKGIDDLLDEVERARANLPAVPVLRAEALSAQGQYDRAEKLLQAARNRCPHQVELWLAQVALAVQRGKPEAAALLDRAESLFRGDAELRLARVRLAARKGAAELRQAEARLVKGSREDGEELRLLRTLAEAYAEAGAEADARRLWEQLGARQPDDLGVQFMRFDLAVRAGDRTAAGEGLARLRRIEGEDGTLWRYARVREVIWRAGRGQKAALDEAPALLQELRRQRPGWARLAVCEGELSELSGNPAAALPAYLRAIDLGERGADVIRRAVGLLYERQRFHEADQVLRKLPEQALLGNLKRLAADVSLRVASTPQEFGKALVQAREAVSPDSQDYRDQLWLGLVLSAADRAEEAEAALRRAVQLSPATPAAWVALVQCLVRHGQKDRARAAVLEAEGKVPRAGSSLALARCHELLGDDARAEAMYKAGVAARGAGDATALAALAGFYLRRGRERDAQAQFEKIVALRSTAREQADWAGRMLAVILAGGDDYERARRGLKMLGLDERGQSASQGQRSPVEKRAQAVALASQKGLALRREATRLFEELFAQQQPTAEEQFFLARLYESIGEAARSRAWLLRLLGAHGGEPRYVAHHAEALLRQGDLAEAEVWIARLEKLAPRGLGALRLRARLLAALGKKDAAVSLVLTASERKEVEVPAVASLLEEIGDARGAERFYVRFAVESRRPEARLRLAELLGRQGQGSAALEQCERARKDCSPEAVARACTAIVYALQPSAAELRRVEGWLEEARKKAPSDELTGHLAALRNRQGRYAEAELLYRQILQHQPGNITALNNLSCLLALGAGRAEEALSLVSRALAVEGPIPYLLDTRALAYLAGKRSDLAVKDLQDAVAEAPTATRYFHLARAQRDAGNRLAAVAAMRKALALGLSPNRLHALELRTHQQLVALSGPG
jgi:tetratricopeptide (TPR) repeat protein